MDYEQSPLARLVVVVILSLLVVGVVCFTVGMASDVFARGS